MNDKNCLIREIRRNLPLKINRSTAVWLRQMRSEHWHYYNSENEKNLWRFKLQQWTEKNEQKKWKEQINNITIKDVIINYIFMFTLWLLFNIPLSVFYPMSTDSYVYILSTDAHNLLLQTTCLVLTPPVMKINSRSKDVSGIDFLLALLNNGWVLSVSVLCLFFPSSSCSFASFTHSSCGQVFHTDKTHRVNTSIWC